MAVASPEEPQESRLRLVGLSLGVTVAAFVLGIAVALVLLLTVQVAGVGVTDVTLLVINLVALQGIAFPVTGYAYLRWRGLSFDFIPVRVPSLREVGIIVAGWVGVLVLLTLASQVVAAVGAETADNAAGQTAIENPEFVPYLIPLVFLLNAPGEELLFRGVIQGTLRERFGGAGAVVVTSLMFAPAHILALVGSLQAALTTITLLMIPSLVFGTVYELTDNFVVPSLVHALFNATLFASIYVAATAGDGTGSALLVVLPV